MEPAIKKCRDCGKDFRIPPKQQKKYRDKGMKPPSRCNSCRIKNRTFETKKCKEKDCGKAFQISELEKEWYIKKGYKEPERCPGCRKKRREAVGK